MESKIKEIRNKLRLSMNGVTSSSMRKNGIDYHLNFGVSIVTLRQIAKEYTPDKQLALKLWNENVRELKILATLIHPIDSIDNPEKWIETINNLELAEQISANLFCKLTNASGYAHRWIKSPDLYTKICGFLTYTKLFINKFQFEVNDRNEYFHIAFNTLNDDSLLLKNIAFNSLKHFGRQSEVNAKTILEEFTRQNNLTDPLKTSIYENLESEFNYYQ